MEPMWHPSWEPFWRAVNEVQLPLRFHTFPTTPPRARNEVPQVRRAAMFTGVSAFQMGLIHIIAGMMGAGVFERYPRLRVSFGESGAGWLAYALHRMDFEFEDRFRDLMKLKPSEYWRRQCKATFQFDPICTKLIDDIGVDDDVGFGLPAHRRHLAGILEIHRGAIRRPLARGRAQDHLRERRQVLQPDQLTAMNRGAASPAGDPGAPSLARRYSSASSR
jgi:hypothetical protein